MSMKKGVALEVRNVTKSFYTPHHLTGSLKESLVHVFKKKDKSIDTYHALKGISFDVKEGEFFGIVGRNGAGKSTLLRILAQIYQPTTGSVHVKGRLVPFIELGVGFNANLTGRQNVYLNGAMLGFSKKEMDERYDTIVEFAELEEFMDQRLKNYSSGMRVRLAFAVAIQADADILLLDEVLAVGDADFKKKCYSYFDTLKRQKKTIIFVSHGMGAIREYCDRAILIENGKVAYEGTADAVADKYMQLFVDKNQEKKTQPKLRRRWGTNEATIEEFDFTHDEKVLRAKVKLKCGDKPLRSIKFGIAIKDKKGRVIAGVSNLNVTGGKPIQLKANESVNLDFILDNIFGNREYSLTATLTSNDGATMYDKWNEVSSFSNNKENVYYPVVSPGKLTIQ